ncbi:hypothetical protein BDV23DRAFT_184222, partial [Aspergillus alliaceus]
MPTLDPKLYTVAWIAPLEIEVQAALHMLDKGHSGGFPVGPGDDYVFHAGEIHGHNVVIATFAAGQPYGTSSAAALASHVRNFFPNLWFGLLVGVAAGLPNLSCAPPRDIRLGDVIVALPEGENPAIVPYGLGKQKGDDGFELLRSGHSLPQTERIVGSAIGKIKAEERDAKVILGYYKNTAQIATKFPDPGQDKDFLYLSGDNTPVSRQRRPDTKRTCVWYGSIGSGDKLLKSAKDRDEMRDKYNVIGLEMEAAGVLNEIRVGNIRGVCDYGDEQKNKDWQPYAAAMAAAFAKAILVEIPPKAMARSEYDFTDEDKRCLQDLLLSNPDDDRRRIEETKGGLLNDSFQWILDNAKYQSWRNNTESQLLWIKGDAGKGKTMLIIGIIKELLQQVKPESSRLLVYFLCQGNDPKLNNATAVLRGLIYMLITQQPHLISHLRKRHDSEGSKLFEGGNTFYGLSAVFESMIQDLKQATVHLLVDALDECQIDLEDLLRFIAKTMSMPSVQVKWIVSSRNIDHIGQILDPDHEANKLSLELNADHISLAIETYINDKVSHLRILKHNQRLQEQVRDQLCQKSDGTFLWVALVIEELRKCRFERDVFDTLKTVPRGLPRLYKQMMQQIQRLEDQHRNVCLTVLSIVILAYRPLHLLEMCHVTDMHPVSDLESAVGMCGSFLTIRDKYVYLIHLSAKDYLDNIYATTAILPERSAIHYKMFSRSLRALSTKLRPNIYNLDNPGVPASKIPILRPTPDPLFDLRYSCMYWLDHFLEVDSKYADETETTENKAISDFFRKCHLHWLESLSLIGEVPHAILTLRKLVYQQQQKQVVNQSTPEMTGLKKSIWKRLRRRPGYVQHHSVFKEAERFASVYGLIIEEAPLQTYSAALVFCPQNSESKRLYWGERLKFIEHASVMQESWDPCMQTLEGHRHSVNAVAFSPDGQTVASASYNTVRLWNIATGAAKQTLQGHTDSVRAVAFSLDGQTVVSASFNGTVRLWDTVTGAAKQTLQGHTDSVRAVAFSPDSQMVASASLDHTIRLWDMATGAAKQTLQGHTDSTVASASLDHTVRLWDMATGAAKWTLQGHRSWVNAVAFSLNGQMVASGSYDRTVQLWDMATGAAKWTLQGHRSWVNAVAFSLNGQMVASGSYDRTVQLWDMATGAA